jgi:hypothetical protein
MGVPPKKIGVPKAHLQNETTFVLSLVLFIDRMDYELSAHLGEEIIP